MEMRHRIESAAGRGAGMQQIAGAQPQQRLTQRCGNARVLVPPGTLRQIEQQPVGTDLVGIDMERPYRARLAGEQKILALGLRR